MMGHVIKQYNSKVYPFQDIVAKLFNVDDLSKVHILDLELTKQEPLVQENEAETFFHKTFYGKLNEGWKELTDTYESFIKNELSKHIKGSFVYQKTPTFRAHVPNQTAVSKWHYDSDPNHGHPDWEINIQIPLTVMRGTAATWVETVPGLGNYESMDMKYGEYVIFDGNRCTHGNYPNNTDKTRVSFDFRIIPCRKYDGYGNNTYTTFKTNNIEDKSIHGDVTKLNTPSSFYGRKWDTSPEGYYNFCENENEL
tara:strand:+ start:660 stop:1418 length:759 start_codon:yes stop_codon:yes gene_type:complete